jgi:hypothetical protein
MPAAISAPNTISSRASVTGIERRDDLPHRLAQLQVGGEGLGRRAALDEHALGVRLLHGRLVQHPFGAAGLAGIVAAGVARAEMLSDRERRGDKHQPADDDDHAVPHGPAGEVAADGMPGPWWCPTVPGWG